ncbi:MAG: methylmalonyl Co-A mutase-associated GTPase MeaB [Deltaproteobacteria bacterium]|nr:MAG: methylmalonyl Co-A mutase-associated GTPase MeaB [Deltaproteobacteria bacterium]
MSASVAEKVERIRKGEVRAAARLMRDLDDEIPEAREVLAKLHPYTGNAYIVGITGNPGSGKSTLTDRLIGQWRADGKSVGVVAIDPTSPFTGGAILGDRVRMQQHATDEGVFIRSLATRGHLGGLSRSTMDVVRVLDAMGKDIIVIETVGVGQDEIEVTRAAHTSVVVVVPGLGDDIQAIKAGILEIADLFVVNKADRPGADRTVQELQMMLELFRPSAAVVPHGGVSAPRGVAQATEDGWEVPILKAVAVKNEGIPELARTLEAHRAHLRETGNLARRERDRARFEFLEALKSRLVRQALEALQASGQLDRIVDRISARRLDPYKAAASVAAGEVLEAGEA